MSERPTSPQPPDAADVAIQVRGVSKIFEVYSTPADMMIEFLTGRPRHQKVHALHDVSFDVYRGEVIGIIGPNGAGKSTLLKIIAATLGATSGEVVTKGRIAAILELGTGFNPEFTGRQNIIMGGMCLGMSREEVSRRSPEIIEFSELGHVIDRPFKTYSSGMQARLTFSTAISVNPDIFIIDEALAAGDAYFVGKCLRRIADICNSGTTVLFVSHASGMIQQLCHRAIHIDQGRIVDSGDVMAVTSRYESLVVERQSRSYKSLTSTAKTRDTAPMATRDSSAGLALDPDMIDVESALREGAISGDTRGWTMSGSALAIEAVTLHASDGAEKYVFFKDEDVVIRIALRAEKILLSPGIYLKIRRSDGIFVTSWYSEEQGQASSLGELRTGCHIIELRMPRLLLGHGDYLVSVLIYPKRQDGEPIKQAYAVYENCPTFAVRWNRPLSSLISHPIEMRYLGQRVA